MGRSSDGSCEGVAGRGQTVRVATTAGMGSKSWQRILKRMGIARQDT